MVWFVVVILAGCGGLHVALRAPAFVVAQASRLLLKKLLIAYLKKPDMFVGEF